jgi:hypothetical protein
MRKPVTLSNKAYQLLAANRSNAKESLSSVILRFVPPPIRTFGDLKKHLDQIEGELHVDLEAIERVRTRKARNPH